MDQVPCVSVGTGSATPVAEGRQYVVCSVRCALAATPLSVSDAPLPVTPWVLVMAIYMASSLKVVVKALGASVLNLACVGESLTPRK